MQKSIILFLRSINRSKLSFIINVISLSIGLTCIFLIYLWVSDEMSVDKFHEHDDRLYQVMMSRKVNGAFQTDANTPAPLANDLVQYVPAVEKAVAVASSLKLNTLSFGEKVMKAKGIYADKDFFEIFSFKLIEGQKEALLSDRGNIVISEEMAMKLFGTTKNLVGKSLEFDRNEQFLVAGVLDKIPANSTLQFDYVLLLPLYEKHVKLELTWTESVTNIYLLLSHHAELDQLNDQILNYLIEDDVPVERVKVFARPFSDGYLYGNYKNEFQKGGRIEYVRLFVIIGIIILLIACINFISLSTAMATKRMKEVGMKKVLGANRQSIIIQHLGESTLLAFLSLFLSLLLVFLLLPSFNDLTDKQMSVNLNLHTLLPFFLITLLTGLLSGIYPAFYISGFKPVMILKDNLSNSPGGLWIRKGLVVTQFSTAVILIIFTIVVYNQFSMIQSRNLGYNKDNIIYFEMDGKVETQRETFLSKLREIPGVQKTSSIFTMNGLFGQMQVTNWIEWPGKNPDERVLMDYRTLDFGMIELLALDMKAGRSFSREYTAESLEVVFNETAIKLMGLENPVGEIVQIWGMDFKIIGIVKDFYIQSIHGGSIQPLLLVRLENRGFGALNNIMVKVNGDRLDETINAIQELHSQFNPGFPLNYKFLDQDFQKQYSSEMKLSVLSRYFAGMSILISCLGLFSLAAFTTKRRTKEIGIRKVLGSSEMGIVKILSGDFTRMVIIAIVMALPVSYLVAHRWLESFAYRVDLEWWYFVGAGLITLLIAWLTVGIQTIKAALVNPAKILRSE